MDILTARLSETIAKLGMSAGTFCELSGVNAVKFSRAVNGSAPFTASEIIRLSAIAADLVALSEGLAPAPIDFRNFDSIKRLLELRHGGISWITVVKVTDEETEPKE